MPEPEPEDEHPPSRLEYSIHSCSSYSGQYGPENILEDNPLDQRSRWSGGNGFSSNTITPSSAIAGSSSAAAAIQASSAGNDPGISRSGTPALGLSYPSTSASASTSTSTGAVLSGSSLRERQWIILKLPRRSVLRTITFGKYTRPHPCNVREFKVFVGLSPHLKSMALVHWGGLKNDSAPETFPVAHRNAEGVVIPCEYVCIEPISAHSSNYNVSIWHVALGGNDDEEYVKRIYSRFSEHRENRTNRLILKHLRQRGLLGAYDALRHSLSSVHPGSLAGSGSGAGAERVELEHPALTELHARLVEHGDFDGTEALLSEIAFPEPSDDTNMAQAQSSLLDGFCRNMSPRVEWTRLDGLPDIASWDGEAPSARGGHQLVLVQPPHHSAPPISQHASADPQTQTQSHSSATSAAGIDIEISSAAGSESAGTSDDGAALYLYGGYDGEKELHDFWSYSLHYQRWHLISTNAQPGPRSCHQMAVDEQTGDIYLFGRFIDNHNARDRSPASPRVPPGPSTGAGAGPPSASRSTMPSQSVPTTAAAGDAGAGRRAYELIAGRSPTPGSNALSAPTGTTADVGTSTSNSPAPASASATASTRPAPLISPAAVAETIQSPIPQLEAQIQGHVSTTTAAAAPSLTVSRNHDNGEDETRPDFWVYHTRGSRAGEWDRLSADTSRDGGPALIFDHQMLVDSEARHLYVFGGKHYSPGEQPRYSGLYRYDIDRRQWTRLCVDVEPSNVTFPKAEAIPSRIGHSMLLDATNKRLIVLAGQRVDAHLADTWSYDIRQGVWECMERDSAATGGPDGGFTQRATMDNKRKEFVLLPGLMRERLPPHHTNVKNSVWIRALEAYTWRRVEATHVTQPSGCSSEAMDVDLDEPKPRFAHQIVYDSVRDEHYLFGGNPSDSATPARLNDFWRMKLIRTSKDEVLRRCKFLVRRCRFHELCDQGDSMRALLYLQTALASVSSPMDQADFLACMSYLLAARSTPASAGDDSMSDSNGDAEDTMMSSQVLPAKGTSGRPHIAPDLKTWKQRTAVFEELLNFFPSDAKEPQEDLLSNAVAWEAVL